MFTLAPTARAVAHPVTPVPRESALRAVAREELAHVLAFAANELRRGPVSRPAAPRGLTRAGVAGLAVRYWATRRRTARDDTRGTVPW